jgi:hypothetical protein
VLLAASGAAGADTAATPPLPFPRAAIPKEAPPYRSLTVPPTALRGIAVEAPAATLGWFLARPSFTWKLLADYDAAPGVYETDDDGESIYRTADGARYRFVPLTVDDTTAAVSFIWLRRAPVGIGLIISGAGVAVVAIHPDGPYGSTIDADLYFVEGDLPLDRTAAAVGAQTRLVADDLRRLVAALADLAEKSASEPEVVYDDLLFAGEVFTDAERNLYRSRFLQRP